jgi:hypothetical protein
MLSIDRSEILPLGEYEKIRDRFRARVIEEKRPRRIKVSGELTAVLENRDTVLLQIQEMLRTERITSEPAIRHEIETYNELLPSATQLSVTLFVEVADKEERDRLLVDLAGLEDALAVEVDGEAFPLTGKREGAVPGRTTAVHYLKCDLSPAAVRGLKARQAKAAIVVRHPKLSARAELSAQTLQKIADDLA